MGHDEQGKGVSTALVVAGGIGCLILGVIGFFGVYLLRGTAGVPPPSATVSPTPTVTPPAGTVTPPGWQGVEWTGAPGQAGHAIVREPTDGSVRELHAYWKEDGALDEARTGAYAGAAGRERALTGEEVAMLGGLRH